jgi:hypothetical protein
MNDGAALANFATLSDVYMVDVGLVSEAEAFGNPRRPF